MRCGVDWWDLLVSRAPVRPWSAKSRRLCAIKANWIKIYELDANVVQHSPSRVPARAKHLGKTTVNPNQRTLLVRHVNNHEIFNQICAPRNQVYEWVVQPGSENGDHVQLVTAQRRPVGVATWSQDADELTIIEAQTAFVIRYVSRIKHTVFLRFLCLG